MSGWLARHLQALLFALGRLVRAPWATGFTVAVIAIALTLPAGFALLVESASRVSDQAATAIDLSVYFKLETPLPEVQQRAAQLRTRPEVSTVQVITAEQALRQLQQDSGLAAALAALGARIESPGRQAAGSCTGCAGCTRWTYCLMVVLGAKGVLAGRPESGCCTGCTKFTSCTPRVY